MNVSGTLNAFRVLYNPSLILPHCTIRTFDQLPIPLSNAFMTQAHPEKRPDIRAVVLDKDNCFAVPHTNVVHPPYSSTLERLKSAYPRTLLIVSNSSGTSTQDPSGSAAKALEEATGVPVLRHSVKKPGCGKEILDYFRQIEGAGVERPDQIAVVGDRIFTDVMLANMMGSWGVWVRDGVQPPRGWTGIWTRAEARLADLLTRRGWHPTEPRSPFET